MQWEQVAFYNPSDDKVTMQVILFEGSHNILMQYKDPALAGGISGTIGVQGSNTQGVQYSKNDAVLSGGLAICFTPAGGNADKCNLRGPDSQGYTFTDSHQPGSPQVFWQEISSTGTSISLGDEASTSISIGFTFPFYGSNYTSLNVNSNGTLSFDSGAMHYHNTTIPDTNAAGTQAHISLYWDDLVPNEAGGIYYATEGNPGDRRLIVQFNKVPHYGSGAENTITAQAILFEASGNILMHYINPSQERASDATIGIQGSPTVGLQYTYGTDPNGKGPLSKRDAICFIAPGKSASDCSFAGWLNKFGEGSVAEAIAYYDKISAPSTFSDWKKDYGFEDQNGVTLAGSINAVYFNNFDLGLGRNMNCRENSNGQLACYVTNYGIAPGGPAQTAINHALTGTNPVATVSMVYDGTGTNGVKFYVYDGSGTRLNQVALDSEGPKNVPHVCLPCHGGSFATDSVSGSSFLPFDVFTYKFSTTDTDYSLSSQQEAFRQLNAMVRDTSPKAAITDVINGMYTNTGGVDTVGATADDTFVPSGWSSDEETYKTVIRHSCRGCHIAQNFNLTSSSYIGSETLLCDDQKMPHAEQPSKNFWTAEDTLIPAYLSATKGWTGCLDSGNDGPIPASFSKIDATSDTDMINKIFHATGSNPTMPWGSLDTATDKLTMEQDGTSTLYKLLFTVGSITGTVNTTVVVEATAKFAHFNWYTTGYVLIPGEVWTSSGWKTYSASENPIKTNGKYYYRVQIADKAIQGDLSMYLETSSPGEAVFYTY